MTQYASSWFTCYHPRPEAKLRLVGFPHGGGGPQAFREWSQLLPDEIELLALHLPGRGSRLDDELAHSMAELTPQIVQALTGYFDKPFAFFGHSVGAVVAFDVARQLQAQQMPLPLHLFASAHKAPHLADDEAPMSQLSNAELVAIIRQLGLAPAQMLEYDEVIDLILPPLKADFALSETYCWDAATPLDVPITALGGRFDELLTSDDLQAWEACTTASFSTQLFDGDHFYTESHQAELLAAIEAGIQQTIEALSPSVLRGEVSPYPQKCLHELLREQALKTPDAVAIVGANQAGDEFHLTFRELDEQSDLLARYLQSQGVKVGCLVGIYMETSVEYVIAFFAALKAGGAYMTVEIAYPEALLQQVLNSAQPVVLLTKERFYTRLSAEWQPRAFQMDAGWIEALNAETLAIPENLPAPTIDSLAQCVMSSGTTGTPKGIVCPHRSAVNSYYWRYEHYPYEANEREACNVFLVWEVARPILQGHPAYIIPDEVIYDPPRLLEYLSRRHITRVLFTPSLLEQILSTPDLDLREKLQDLRVVYLNGEVVTTALRNRFAELLPNVVLLNDYSTAEAHDTCHLNLADLDAVFSPKYAPVGVPMSNVDLYVLDDEQQPVPMGFQGELYIGGESVGQGYLQQPEKTAERFPPNPFRTDDFPMFRTGDAGRVLPNGQVEIQGRIAFMVKLRGYSIVPGAIETTIVEHPAVNAAVVVTQDNEETGQPEHLVAYVVGNGELADDSLLEELRTYLRAHLPHYAVPSYLIPLTELPIAANGKLNRRKLPKADANALRSQGANLRKPPQTEAEQAIAQIWQTLLNQDEIAITDNFFDLGGHSLRAAQLCAQLRESLDLQVSVVDIFQYPTLGELAQALADQFVDQFGDQFGAAHAHSATQAPRLSVPRAPLAPATTDIAIIGLACRFPGADDAEQFWQNLRDGACSIRPLSDEELAQAGIPPAVYNRSDYVKMAAPLDNVDRFDRDFWGLSRREAVQMDPQHRLFLECCWQALEHAGHPPTQNGERTGVFAGAFLPLYLLHHLHGGGLMDPTNAPLASLTEFGNDKDYLATRVSYLLNLRGPSVSVQTSCSTGLVAVATACQSLQMGQCDVALAGASSIIFPQAGYQYVESFINSPDGHCRAFDAEANGTVLGDGVGVLVLKRLADAEADGDNILAVIKGYAVNNDGNLKAGYSAPGVQGQMEVVASAQAMAGIDPETISYIEAHGTGTLVGDPIEVRALATVFQQATDRTGYCALGSVKPNIGHSNIAAGVAGLIKTVMAMQHRQLPPTINFKTPNPAMNLAQTPFFVNDRLRDWEIPHGSPRRAGVTSLGIGGTNCHVILEEWPVRNGEGGITDLEESAERRQSTRPSHLLTLSAKSDADLARATVQLADYLERHPDLNLADVAYTLQVGRCAFDHRRAIVCQDGGAANALRQLNANDAHTGVHKAQKRPVVFMFPGQGAQYIGMGRDLYASESIFRAEVDRCCDLLQPHLGLDLRTILLPGTGEEEAATDKLTQTQITQPTLFTVEYALAKLWMSWGIQPEAMIGHSIGEYVAATLAGVFTLADALSLVAARGRLMQGLPAGSMLVVMLSEKEVQPYLTADLSLAAVNGQTLCVLSGTDEAVDQAEQALTAQDVGTRRLHTSHAFHSQMMAPILEPFTEAVAAIERMAPQIPYISNVTGNWITPEEATDPAYYARHLRQGVRFAEGIHHLVQEPNWILLEVGPGRTLTTFARRHPKRAAEQIVLTTLPHATADDADSDLAFMQMTLGRLWLAGVPIEWADYYAHEKPQRIPLPAYPFFGKRIWPSTSVKPSTSTEMSATNGLLGPSAIAQSAGRLSLDGRFYIPSWKRTVKPQRWPVPRAEMPVQNGSEKAAVTTGQRWLLFLEPLDTGARGQLGDQIANLLEQSGHQVHRVYRLDGARAEGERQSEHSSVHYLAPTQDAYLALLERLATAEAYPERILYLWSLSDLETDTPVDALPDLRAYDDFVHLAQALSTVANPAPLNLWVVTNGAVQVDQESIVPTRAMLWGPATVLPQENPQIACRMVDVRWSQSALRAAGMAQVAEQIGAECITAHPDGEALIALRGHYRWAPRYESIQLDALRDEGATRIRHGGVYIITGGLGRIGLALAERLAQKECKVVLTTRRAFPAKAEWESLAQADDVETELRDQWQTLLALEAAGGAVTVMQVDMADADGVESMLIDTVSTYGALHGIFHAAGLADLRYLTDLTDDVSEQEFASKVVGLHHLDRAVGKLAQTHNAKPEFVFLFSSMASILGGLAMTAYASANRFMDAFVAADPLRHGVRWIGSNWDDWDFDYGKENIEAYAYSEANSTAIPPAEALELLERILQHALPTSVLVATRALPARLSQWVHQKTWYEASHEHQQADDHAYQQQNGAAPAHHLTGDEDKVQGKQPQNSLERRILRVYQDCLGGEEISADDNFFDIGGDSLLATQILLKLQQSLSNNRPIKLRHIFDYPTVQDLAHWVGQTVADEA